jgi:glycosyltransferase involved in cell wall biosynthesis
MRRPIDRPPVAIVHDYLTQTGGAERVVLSMLSAFPGAPVYTALYEPGSTFPEFRHVDVRPIGTLNAIAPLRRDHRRGLALYGPAFRHLRVEADVVLCSSSGWAHQVEAVGRKIVYCHTPARWLYQTDTYVHRLPRLRRTALALLGSRLRRSDVRAASTASHYLANSTVVRERIKDLYGIDAEVLAPPPALSPLGASRPVGVEPGYLLVVSRLLSYKNVDVVLAASRSGRRIVVVGEGPDRSRLQALATRHVTFLGRVDDDQLRWLYRNASALVSAAHEDFGLAPIEANAFGVPVVVLRWGGFVDTVVEDVTGLFFDEPDALSLEGALDRLDQRSWDQARLRAHAEVFSESQFVEGLRAAIDGTRVRVATAPELRGTG